MKIRQLKKVFQSSERHKLIVYLILRFLVLLCMVREIFLGNIMNALLCVLSLILFLLPVFIEKTFKVDLPNTLEIIILLFIFSAEILGEINNFYIRIENFDTILHTLNGFLCAGVGLSLVNLLNNNVESFNLSQVFVIIVAFCFSMTVGIFWEFFEYGMDKYFNFDMQKDTILSEIKSVKFDKDNKNDVVSVNDIERTIIVDKELNITEVNGYLDIGLYDTIDDLKVNFVGAAIFSAFGYVYLKTKEKFKFIKSFVIVKK